MTGAHFEKRVRWLIIKHKLLPWALIQILTNPKINTNIAYHDVTKRFYTKKKFILDMHVIIIVKNV